VVTENLTVTNVHVLLIRTMLYIFGFQMSFYYLRSLTSACWRHKTLSADGTRVVKLQRHLVTGHADQADISLDVFNQKMDETKQKTRF